jgi:hypothetical protein
VPPDRLPSDFASIPFNHPKGTVLASVASTPQAQEASISASVPQTATVKRSEAKMPTPQYDGEPRFQSIEGTSLQYAVNTATPVIETAPGQYYAVVNGVWFAGSTPSGPWLIADSVPPAIYAIPPSSPVYYVTYVRVYGATPDVVYVGYTPGYYGTYVVPAGTVVYGTGYVYQPLVGSVWIGPPYTYGFGAGFAFGAAPGFAFGFGAGAYCHPWWGPAGWGYGWGSSHDDVDINRNVNINNVNVYDRWGHNTVVNGGNRYAGHVGNTTFAGNKNGDVYADRNGNVYRRQDDGWQKYDDGDWNDLDKQNAQNRAQNARAQNQDAAQRDQQVAARQDQQRRRPECRRARRAAGRGIRARRHAGRRSRDHQRPRPRLASTPAGRSALELVPRRRRSLGRLRCGRCRPLRRRRPVRRWIQRRCAVRRRRLPRRRRTALTRGRARVRCGGTLSSCGSPTPGRRARCSAPRRASDGMRRARRPAGRSRPRSRGRRRPRRCGSRRR